MKLTLFLAALFLLLLAWRGIRRHRSRHEIRKHPVRDLRLSLYLRRHPGPGFASSWEIFRHWSAFASFRESKRTRPSLTRWHRLTHPHEHGFFIGRAHHFRKLWVTVQEHGALIGPPRFFKTALLAFLVMFAPGSAVCTSSKPDIYWLTWKLRAQGRRHRLRKLWALITRRKYVPPKARPVYVFAPQFDSLPRNVRWSPILGCEQPAVAIRRAQAFAGAAATEGTEDATFWQGKAKDSLQAMFAAAAMMGQDATALAKWSSPGGGGVNVPVAVLRQHNADDWANKLAMLLGEATKTIETIQMVMQRALGFLDDPELAQAVLPAEGEQFDIDRFLAERGTLYMIAKSNGDDDASLAPLFAALACEIQFRATQIAAKTDGGRLDPPLLMALDEVTQICPVPLPGWLADSGGQGISIWTGFHTPAQLEQRWKKTGKQIVMGTSNTVIYMPGIQDTDTLDDASRLCGTVHATSDGKVIHDHVFMPPHRIRMMPKGYALAIRTNGAPVAFKVNAGWNHPEFRAVKRAEKRAEREQRRAARKRVPVTGAPAIESLPDPEEVVAALLRIGEREGTREPATVPAGAARTDAALTADVALAADFLSKVAMSGGKVTAHVTGEYLNSAEAKADPSLQLLMTANDLIERIRGGGDAEARQQAEGMVTALKEELAAEPEGTDGTSWLDES